MTLFLSGCKTYNIYGLIELLTVNLALPMSVTKLYLYFIIGIIFTGLTFVVFTFLIKKLNINTPGRADDWGEEAGTNSSEPVVVNDEIANLIIEGLGGKDNVVTAGCCMTRLRCEVKDPSLVKDDILNKVPNRGLVKNGKEIQIVVGLKVHDYYDKIKPILRIED